MKVYSGIRIPTAWAKLMDERKREGAFESRIHAVTEAAERVIARYSLRKSRAKRKIDRADAIVVKLPFEKLDLIRNAAETGRIPYNSAEEAIKTELREMLFGTPGGENT